MPKCTNPDLGALLHAYEIGSESEEVAELFEIHLLECDYCFDELMSFRREAALLKWDDDVKRLTGEDVTAQALRLEPPARRFWRWIWPAAPFIFKPAPAYLVILLLLLPAYLGIQQFTREEIKQVQSMSLFPNRSAAEAVLRISGGDDALLSFVFQGAIAGESYQVVVTDEEGGVLFHDDVYRGFDEYETGRLLLSLSGMKPGRYRLVITDPRGDAASATQEYSFSIEE